MRTNIISSIILMMILAGCGSRGNSQGQSEFEQGEKLATVANKKLKEASGLVASIVNPGMLWTHNDSGNEPEVFLIDENANIKMTVKLKGIENRDWEDIAVGPGPDPTQSYLYIADIGDNKGVHPFKYIYRIPEPRFSSESETSVSDTDAIIFKLEGEIKDTESLLIDKETKNLYVISKRENPVYLYEIKQPQSKTDTVTATKLYSLPFSEIVAADCFSETGDILIKNYQSIFYWKNANHAPISTLLKQKPIEVPYEEEPQGESIAWARDGSGFYTVSESKKKTDAYLYFYKRK